MIQDRTLSASILAANFAHLKQECDDVINAGCDWIHLDVMDNHYVPNLSIGPAVLKSLRKAGMSAPVDVHLMITNPESMIEPFAKAGANLIAFHPETSITPRQTVQKINEAGCQAGLVISPDTPLSLSASLINDIDLLLIMTVYPGFAGQKYLEKSHRKITEAQNLIRFSRRKVMLGVDGGVGLDTINDAAKAGADFFIVGSGIFSANDYEKRIAELKGHPQS